MKPGAFLKQWKLDDFGRKQALTSLYNDILARDISSRYGASFDIVDSGVILTEDHEITLEENGKTIRYMPIWKWLLIPPKDILTENISRISEDSKLGELFLTESF